MTATDTVIALARQVVATDPAQTLLLLDRLNDLDVALWELDNVAVLEGRNVLPDATDDQASVIERWARR